MLGPFVADEHFVSVGEHISMVGIEYMSLFMARDDIIGKQQDKGEYL